MDFVTKSGTVGEALGPDNSLSFVIPANTKPGEFDVRTRGARHAPVRTRSVARPPALPNSMSVFSLSPTMMVRLGSKSCLQLPAAHQHPRILVSRRWMAHFALMQSSIVRCGFPMAIGSRPRA